MKKFLIVMCLLTATFFICSNADSAGAGIGKGTNELSGFGSLSSMKAEGDGESITVDTTLFLVGFGQFVTNEVQVGGSLVRLASTIKSEGTKEEASATGLDLYGKYHFYEKGQPAVPYVGLQLGYMNMTSDDSSGGAISYGAMGGLKYFITENTSFNTELNYRHYNMDFEGSSVGMNNLSLLFGFSYYFGK